MHSNRTDVIRSARLLLVLLLLSLLAACASAPPPAPSLRQEQQTTLRELGFDETEGGDWLMTIAEPVSFELNRSDLREPLRVILEQMAQQLLQVKIDHVRCEGHTDSTGAQAYNKRLSQARAQAVADVFIANGFAPEQAEAIGHASDYPVGDNATREGRSANRRVEVIVPALVLSQD